RSVDSIAFKGAMKRMMMLVLALSACATIPKADQVKIRAAHDLACTEEQVQATQVDPKTFHVAACGKEATYTEECVSADTTRCSWVAQRGGTATTVGGQTPSAQ